MRLVPNWADEVEGADPFVHVAMWLVKVALRLGLGVVKLKRLMSVVCENGVNCGVVLCFNRRRCVRQTSSTPWGSRPLHHV